MRQTISILALGVSLVLCVAAVVLWTRSYVVQDIINIHRSAPTREHFYTTDHRLYSVRGQFVWKVEMREQPPEFANADARSRAQNNLKDFYYNTAPTDQFYFNPANQRDPWWVRCGFRYAHETFKQTGGFAIRSDFYELRLPHWLFAAVLALLPATWLVALLRHRRQLARVRAGLCPACGYDLRATPDRCPECGAVSHSSDQDTTQRGPRR